MSRNFWLFLAQRSQRWIREFRLGAFATNKKLSRKKAARECAESGANEQG
jgi:hypothetical protein